MSEVTAIVLAAGLSTRFGDANKLLSLVDGESLICKVVRTVQESGFHALVVTGHEADTIEQALEGVCVVQNPKFVEGLGTSIACGVSASAEATGWLIVPGDMPNLMVSTLSKIVAAGLGAGPNGLVACRLGNTISPPCFFGKAYFESLAGLTGTKGAKAVLEANHEYLALLDIAPVELEDIDVLKSSKD